MLWFFVESEGSAEQCLALGWHVKTANESQHLTRQRMLQGLMETLAAPAGEVGHCG